MTVFSSTAADKVKYLRWCLDRKKNQICYFARKKLRIFVVLTDH